MYYTSIGYFLIFAALIITIIADVFLRTRYSKYQKVKIKSEITGAEAARQILAANGLENVYVVETKGYLNDHYDPRQKVVRLSTKVYHEASIASVAVAAHECGHAIQDKENYLPMKIRSFLVPFASFGTRFGYISVLIGLLFGAFNIAWIGVFLLGFILLFQLATLPVEFDASRRGKSILKKEHILDTNESVGASKVLTAAAMTYVASLLSTVFDLLRLVLLLTNNNDR